MDFMYKHGIIEIFYPKGALSSKPLNSRTMGEFIVV